MNHCKHIILFLLFILSAFGDRFKTGKLVGHLHAKIEQLRSKYDALYGQATPKPMKLWELELEDKLSYPRGDKYKLHEISKQWIRYYECCTHALRTLTVSGSLPAISITAYDGAVARIPCGICASRLNGQPTWLYAPSLNNLTYAPMEIRESAVFADGLLSIYQVRVEHAGVYMCQLGASFGETVMLEVVDYDTEGNYTVVKPKSSHGPYAQPATTYKDITVFSSWTPWSECSRCGRWGRRRRYGMCHVKLNSPRNKKIKTKTLPTTTSKQDIVCEEGSKFLEAFPRGVGCRSRFLPKCLRNLPAVKHRPNEIMIAMCKPPCLNNVIFKVLTETGVELERANNSAGIYSLAMPAPAQPPPPARDHLFAVRGQPALIRCRGRWARDVPVWWRVGAARVSERALDLESKGRVRVNARDHVVIANVLDSDANLYSCWQDAVLVGTVKLSVWSSNAVVASRLMLILGAVVALYTLHLLRSGRHRRRI